MRLIKDQKSFLGAFLWILNVQYYIVQIFVAYGFRLESYSFSNNTISDLGNTSCGEYSGRLVCSPRHTLMNLSFIILAICIVGGILLLRKQLVVNRITGFATAFIILAAIGTILVGLFPENSISALHLTGAALSFIFGNLAMILLGIYLRKLPRLIRIYTFLSGSIGLLASLFFVTDSYLGIGIGGIERFAAYPQSIWMIVYGSYFIFNLRNEHSSN